MDNIFMLSSEISSKKKTIVTTCLTFSLAVLLHGIGYVSGLLLCLAPFSSAIADDAPAAPHQAAPPPPPAPKAAKLTATNTPVTSEQDPAIAKMQEEAQSKYIMALNELQMLKIARELSEVNQAIINSKVATVQAEKNLLALLKSTSTSSGGFNIGGEDSTSAAPTPTPPLPSPSIQAAAALDDSAYSVVSVSQLQHQWHAVLSYQGKLYNLKIGDMIPPSNFVVSAINTSGIVLSKNGFKKKIPLVSII